MSEIRVSVVMPLYNEEKYISNCLESLLKQDYPTEKMEWIFVDGGSHDKTKEILDRYQQKYNSLIAILDNPNRTTPCAMNIGISASIGEYIVRLDAHAEYATDYISKCVWLLDTTDADNVGGVAETEANGFIGKSIAKMLSGRFGVGCSDFRIGEGNRYVDTVPFGAFRRQVFERVGLFNPKLLRSEDNDMNSRIRASGGKIWLAEDIRFKYFCRDTVGGVLKMGLCNGNALFFTLKENPKAMSIRHFVPFAFVMSLLLFIGATIIWPLVGYVLVAELALYLLFDIYFSFFNKSPQYGLCTFWLYPTFHIVYGIGSIFGLFGIKLY